VEVSLRATGGLASDDAGRGAFGDEVSAASPDEMTSSVSVFHSPQPVHCPVHFG